MNLAFTGTIKDEILDKEEIAFHLIKYLIKNNLTELCEKYKLNKEEITNSNKEENELILEVIEQIGKNRGALSQGRNNRQ